MHFLLGLHEPLTVRTYLSITSVHLILKTKMKKRLWTKGPAAKNNSKGLNFETGESSFMLLNILSSSV